MYFGLYKTIVTKRVAAYTYGVEFEGNKFHILLQKGEEVPETSVKTLSGLPTRPDQTTILWPILCSDLGNPTNASHGRILNFQVLHLKSFCPYQHYY